MRVREVLRLALATITSWRRSTPDPPAERPGADSQFSTWPRVRNTDPNPEHQADEDDRRWTP